MPVDDVDPCSSPGRAVGEAQIPAPISPAGSVLSVAATILCVAKSTRSSCPGTSGQSAETRDADVGGAVVDQRARPVVVAPLGAVIARRHPPEHGARRRIQRVPVRVASADVDDTVLHRRGRGDAGAARVAGGRTDRHTQKAAATSARRSPRRAHTRSRPTSRRTRRHRRRSPRRPRRRPSWKLQSKERRLALLAESPVSLLAEVRSDEAVEVGRPEVVRAPGSTKPGARPGRRGSATPSRTRPGGSRIPRDHASSPRRAVPALDARPPETLPLSERRMSIWTRARAGGDPIAHSRRALGRAACPGGGGQASPASAWRCAGL